MPKQTDPDTYLPLKPASFHVLLALADGPRHGASIREAVATLTRGAVTLWPVTLYGSIRELDEARLIEPVPDGDEDARRRSWRLTRLGARVLAAETARLRAIVEHAERARAVSRA
ncbi:MAG TPA: helix-turn-helix transcriptional regulator [Longimicrobiales bacterium]